MKGRASRALLASGVQSILGLSVIGLLSSSPAAAVITLTSNPTTLAQAIEHTAGTITGASFVALPPNGTPHGTATGPLDGFPTDGTTFTILTNGDAALADQPNSAGDSGADDGGGNVRGNSNWDVSILEIDLDVPPLANCLSIDFRFLSDEYPEWVGSEFNDAFIAELDNSTWTTNGPTITAPDNFAFDPSSNVISVNAAGVTSMTAANAAGTTYDGATPLLSASTPITPGAHSLYLSIFDVGDRGIDSAVFLDRLVLSTTDPGACQVGATVLSVTKTVNPSTVYPGATVQYTVNVNNPSAGAVTLNAITDVLPAGFSYVPGSTTGVATADPGISGPNLTWSGPFTLPAASTVSLQFNSTASTTPGNYLNNASATAVGSPVTPSGPTAQVTVNPIPPLCGNGTLDPGEQCDDGNLVDGDGCDSNCTLTACGNGIVTSGEVCDDGNLIDGDGCDSNCTLTGCGNGIVTGGEQCDDGNTIDGDGCSASCQVEVFCGNGIVDAGETCDPPGAPMLPNGNLCRADCTFCGDGIVNGPPGTETCDDANANNTDSCQNTCVGGLRRDPASIKFHGSSRPNDRLQLNGLVIPRLPVNPDGLLLTVRLSNTSGVIYEASLAGRSLVTRGRSFKYRARHAATAVQGGIASLYIAPHRDGYRVKVVAYGDLSRATLADMTLEILFGSQAYQNSGTWTQTRTGWRLFDVPTP
jgi:uncharacterized repeat protein (TIGR01451 family)